MDKIIRIGTRSSELALWQAKAVAQQLQHLGHEIEIVKIDSIGDVVLDKPLYELGVTGVFTRNLDVALLNGDIDIAVHSFKDVPTLLPEGIVQGAILKRGDFNDVLVLRDDENFFTLDTAIIATGSLRRKAQWLYRYPHHQITGLRGNVNTRLQKLEESDWDGAILAAAGLKRLKLLPEKEKFIKLDWMVPAPAQGAVMVAVLEENEELRAVISELNDELSANCVKIEREFLRDLEGGCTAPIGALAMMIKEEIVFKGVLFSPDGKNKMEFVKTVAPDKTDGLGAYAARYIIERGGKKLMREEIIIEKEINIYATKNLSLDQSNSISSHLGSDMSDFITTRSNRIKPLVVKKPIENVVFTSQNAVEALLESFSPMELDFKNIYCVGKRTKRLIERKIGKVAQEEVSAEKLANYLVESMEGTEITFFCGNKKRDELSTILGENNITVTEVECYQTSLTPRVIEGKYQGVLFFSPSGIESYLKMNTSAEMVAFCIGETTASEARKQFDNVIVSKVSTIESVIKSANDYFKETEISE